MRLLMLVVFLTSFSIDASAKGRGGGGSGGTHKVKSYTKKDGTHVEQHKAKNPKPKQK
jgi:hypothetical protein